MRTTILLAIAVLAGAACSRRADDPESAYRLFLDRVQKRDADGAFALLAPETREALAAIARERAGGGTAASLLAGARIARPVEAIALGRQEGDRATLFVQAGGRRHAIDLVREGEAWRIRLDLSAASEATAPASER